MSLQGRVTGTGTSPASILYNRAVQREKENAHPIYQHSSLSTSSSPLRRSLHLREDGTEEEIAWFGSTVIWSRGVEIHRRWTYESKGNEGEKVSWAGFVYFPCSQHPQNDHCSSSSRQASNSQSEKSKLGQKDGTFGPFHTDRQNAVWSTSPSSASSSSTNAAGRANQDRKTVRTVMIFFQSRAIVYYPTGDHHTIHIPFLIQSAYPLPRETGGLILQRQLDQRELRASRPGSSQSVLRGLDAGHHSILDEVEKLDDLLGGGEEVGSIPRLYTLHNPFEELKPVVEAVVGEGDMIDDEEAIGPSTELIFVAEEYPLVVSWDHPTGEFIFYIRRHIPIQEKPAPKPPSRYLRPQELLAQPPSSALPVPGNTTMATAKPGGRPSLQRNASTFSKSDRRTSNLPPMSTDTLDRSRRGPRVSRSGVVEPQHPQPLSHPTSGLLHVPPNGSTGELQATLDPPTLPTSSSAHTHPAVPVSGAGSRIMPRGKGRSSIANDRRLSGLSGGGNSFVRDEPERRGNVLMAAKERDLRETTMLMGLEKEDSGRSEVILQRRKTWRPSRPVDPEKIRIFLSDTQTRDKATINICLSNATHQFTAQNAGGWRIALLGNTPCEAALPIIRARHEIFDVLLLNQGRLSILADGQRIPVQIAESLEGRDELPHQLASSLTMVLDADDSMGDKKPTRGSREIVRISDAVGSRFTAVYEDGEQVGVDLDHRIKDGLIRQCVEAISCVSDSKDALSLRFQTIIALQRLESTMGEHTETPWNVFCATLLRSLGISKSNLDSRPKDSHEMSSCAITRKLALHLRAKRGLPSTAESSSPPPISQAVSTQSSPAGLVLALHLVGQDCRLSQSRHAELTRIAGLIVQLCDLVGRDDWRDYWTRLVPSSTATPRVPALTNIDTSILTQFEQPPDIITYLTRRLQRPLKPFPNPRDSDQTSAGADMSQLCAATSRIIDLYNHLCVPSNQITDPKERLYSLQGRAGKMVSFMVASNLNYEYINDLPVGIAMPILEMIRVAQTVPSKDWSAEEFRLIGRTDLAAQAGGRVVAASSSTSREEDSQKDIGSIMASVADSRKKDGKSASVKTFVRFGADRREAEVERMMQTTDVRTIKVQLPKNASDTDTAAYQQSMVNTTANRTLSILVGQGIFEYGTKTTDITDIFDIPLIELTVKVVPGKQTLQAQIVPEHADWPCFHNGVSSALSISSEAKGIDSSWIIFNRPQSLNPEHGGFLLGLGLTGHLRSLATYHAFPYMEPRHDFTSVGLLLGLAASFVGSEDLLLTKVLSLHTHALLPLGSMELNASAVIQSTALVGLGLVYVGTRNLRMAEVALGEVGRKEIAGVDGFKDNVEAYSFSASVAFGLIMLGRGGQTTSEVDRRLLAKLTRCIVGTPPSVEQQDSGLSEPDAIDTTITAPGATLALGFMYLKTGRQDVADILEIPSSAFALEHVRPDILLLRTFARGLIMWNDIVPSLAWIDTQIPQFIDHGNHKKSSQLELQTELAYMNILAGACLAVGLKYAGTAGETAHNTLMTCYNTLSKAAMGTSTTYEGRIRRTAARQALNVVTIAWTVVMSGTGELNVLRRLRISHGMEGPGVNYGTHMAMHMALGILFCGRGYYTLGSSNLAIAAMAISFFPRFSTTPGENRAYPQAFRHLWTLAVEPRCLVAKDVDTRETVYLPVKVKLNENSQSKDGSAGQIRTQSLISPTLIAPFEQILSIEVDSPRYWPITYDLSNERDRKALVKTRTIWVKRKAGYLNYNSDAKGHRNIFVRAGAMTGWDLHYDLISPASPPSISAAETVELISAHSGDPAFVGLANHFKGETRLDKAVRIALLECVSLDKPALVPIYLSLLQALRLDSASTLTHSSASIGSTNSTFESPMEVIRQLSFLKSFYASRGLFERSYAVQTNRERPIGLIRVNFILTLYRLLTASEPHEKVLERYLTDGTVDSAPARDLAVYLTKNNVPPLQLLRALMERIQGGRCKDESRDTMALRVRDTAKAYTTALVRQWDLMDDSRGDEKASDWKMESIEDALNVFISR